ncbi:Cilia- and flagella-associated protein 46, partial [Geodia barretti]
SLCVCWYHKSLHSVAAEKALALLASLLTRSAVQSRAPLKARCVYGRGRAQLLMARQANPDSPCVWRQREEADGTDGVPQTVDGGEVVGAATASQVNSISHQEVKIAQSESVQYLARGSQSLREPLTLALQSRDMNVAAMAAMKIVESCGTSDAQSTALHLAVYQSCVASQGLLQLLREILCDPSQSRLAVLLHQHSQLTSPSPLSPSPPSPPPPPLLLEELTEQLNTYTCWHRLGVSADYMDLLKHFPPHFRFLVLQHSDDKSHLYSAYLVPPQPPPPAAKKGGPPPVAVSEMPVVARVAVSTDDRERLVNMVASSHRLQTQQLLKPLGDSSPFDSTVNHQFSSIKEAMDNYLTPALEPISTALLEKSDQGLTVVLLADFDLLQLPLEAMSLLQSQCVKSVSRDFSLQMQYHRIQKFLVEDEAVSATKKGKFQLQPSFLQSNITNFKYILDPRCELSNDSGNEGQQPAYKIMSQINAFPKITSKWTGHRGTTPEQAMSSSQWYPIVEQCSGFLFLGSERLAAHFPPGQLASLSMQDCSIAIVMDHMHTLKSSLTQSKLDLHKSKEEIEAEQSLQTAALLSLAGVSCLLSRQWSSTVDSCTDTVCNFLKSTPNYCLVESVVWLT